MKTYRIHYCERRHRSYYTTAKCLWPRAHWIAGEGEYATLARCRVLTVGLWPRMQAAVDAMVAIEVFGCGGVCRGDHELIRLSFPHLLPELPHV